MIEKRYQTFWPRFWAGCIDGLVFLPLSLVDKLIWKYYTGIPTLILLIWYTVSSLLFLIYSIVMHGKFGQTLGKMATHVRVLDISENQLTMSQAIKRDIIPLSLSIIGIVLDAPRILSGINIVDPASVKLDASYYMLTFTDAAWFFLEVITMLFSEKRRALHDFIAGSLVIRLPQQTAAPDHQ